MGRPPKPQTDIDRADKATKIRSRQIRIQEKEGTLISRVEVEKTWHTTGQQIRVSIDGAVSRAAEKIADLHPELSREDRISLITAAFRAELEGALMELLRVPV